MITAPGVALEAQQPRCVQAGDGRSGTFLDVESAQALPHLGQTPDLVRIVAARQQVVGSGKFDGELESPEIEVRASGGLL